VKADMPDKHFGGMLVEIYREVCEKVFKGDFKKAVTTEKKGRR